MIMRFSLSMGYIFSLGSPPPCKNNVKGESDKTSPQAYAGVTQ